MMEEYSEECLLTFLEKQGQLFDEPVAETLAEAEAFLEDCMAVVAESINEVRGYFEDTGVSFPPPGSSRVCPSSHLLSVWAGS